MNRQVLPSMALSVLIVCFFAIVLFEREPGQAVMPDQQAQAGAPAKVENVSSAVRRADSSIAPISAPAQVPATDPAVSAARKAEPVATPKVAAMPVPGVVPKPVAAAPIGIQPAPSSPAPQAEPQPIRPASARAEAPVSQVAASREARLLNSPVAGPRPAFTAVEQGETLEEVAQRVYGSRALDRLDLLWKSNRDVMVRHDSRLSPGTILRTPAE